MLKVLYAFQEKIEGVTIHLKYLSKSTRSNNGISTTETEYKYQNNNRSCKKAPELSPKLEQNMMNFKIFKFC